MGMERKAFWEDMHGLFNFGLGEAKSMAGNHACFCLSLMGPAVEADGCMLIKARVDDAAQFSWAQSGRPCISDIPSQVGGKVVLRASFQDYEAVLRRATNIRVLQAFVHHKEGITILDATAGPAFFAGMVRTSCHKVLQVAEVFAGGFAGWSRAVAALRDGGIPVHVSWILERDSSCWPLLQAMDPSLKTASDVSQVPSAAQPSDTVLLATDFRDPWWMKATHLRPIDILLASPPCQPWSSAGCAHGFHSGDGMLLLELVEYVRVAVPPVVVLEEVDGFARHSHFSVFYSAMRSAGYVCQWRSSLQLSEIAPASRKRYFLVFVHQDFAVDVSFCARTWVTLGFPSMLDAQAYFPHLPGGLLQPCQLSHEVMELYLSPALLPRGPGGRPAASVQAARIRTPSQQATCFMAQYHRQHLLPRSHLESKGLLGTLLKTAEGVRFYSAPEIAVSQGVNGWMLLPKCDQTCVRVLGNALATPHAGFVMGLALQFFPRQVPGVDAAACVDMCQRATIRFPQALLLEVADGWYLCHQDKVGQLLACGGIKTQISRFLTPGEHTFRKVDFAAGEGSCTRRFSLLVSQHVTDLELVPFLQIQADLIVPATVEPATVERCTKIDCARPPEWFSSSLVAARPFPGPLMLVWAAGQGFLLTKHSPDAFQQLRQVFDTLNPVPLTKAACFDFSGSRIYRLCDMPAMTLAVPDDGRVLRDSPVLTPPIIATAALSLSLHDGTLTVQQPGAEDWYLSFPCHLLEAIGWDVTFSKFPMQLDQSLAAHMRPHHGTAFSLLSVQRWLRNLTFLAPLRVADEMCHRSSACATAIAVEVQIGSCTVWEGLLPEWTCFGDLENSWDAACTLAVCSQAARAYSGPFPVLSGTALAEAREVQPGKYMRRKATGRLVLSLMLSCSGGGARDNRLQTLRSRLAGVCLQQGLSLQELNVLVDKLTQHVPHQHLQQALDARTVQEQWQSLCQHMQKHSI